MSYVRVVIGNANFDTGLQCIVKVDQDFTFIDTYAKEAFKIACKKLRLNEDDCCILDYQFYGDDLRLLL